MHRRRAALLVAATAFPSVASTPATAETVRGVATTRLPLLEQAQRASLSGTADSMQARYDAARAIVEQLGGRTSPDCGETLTALLAYARENVAAAEAFDRMADRTRIERRVRATGGKARRALARCAVGRLAARRLARAPAVTLPPSAARPIRVAKLDHRLEARLAELATGFTGYSAVVVRDLATGRTGSWNADARFPAASTVKLGVLVASLRAAGARPERSGRWYDLVQLTGWSSNLAANRLYSMLGPGVVESTLRHMGAAASTYPGAYRVGTSHEATPRQPPLVSQRVTTAADLAAVLATIHGAAFGNTAAMRASGLSRHQARLALALLLRSKPVGDNVGLFHGALPAGVPVAVKNGWLSDAFHTAAILYTPTGPVVCVVLTYRDGLTRVDATRLGAGVVGVALRR